MKEAGEVIAIERGKSKAFCRVVWVGEANSELQGQIGLQCVESDRVLWEAELRDMVGSWKDEADLAAAIVEGTLSRPEV